MSEQTMDAWCPCGITVQTVPAVVARLEDLPEWERCPVCLQQVRFMPVSAEVTL